MLLVERGFGYCRVFCFTDFAFSEPPPIESFVCCVLQVSLWDVAVRCSGILCFGNSKIAKIFE